MMWQPIMLVMELTVLMVLLFTSSIAMRCA